MIEILKISLILYMVDTLIQEEHTLLSWYGKLIERFPWYFKKPLGGCYMCFTGQMCFWYYLLNRIALHQYDGLDHLFYVFASVLMSMVYNKIYCYLR